MPEQKLEATKIRLWFSENLKSMASLIAQSEKEATEKEASGALKISAFADILNDVADKLDKGKFCLLVIGDFNRGKSTILNALFKQKLLPMGATATTAIPTFIKYGPQKEVIIHKKSGTTERLSLEEYRKHYTLNSKQVKDKVKRLYKSVSGWLEPLDYAEFYFPLDALSGGVEFIDTAGLNHTEEENIKTFSYIQNCHVILFVLSAAQPFTQKEQEYLQRFLNKKEEVESLEAKAEIAFQDSASAGSDQQVYSRRPIFYLINKWENVEEEDKSEVREGFAESFEKCLDIPVERVKQLWNESIFDIYGKTALEKLTRGESFEHTGLDVFQNRLDSFLINERLMIEIEQAADSARVVSNQVIEKIDYRLSSLSESVNSLEEKIAKANPHIDVMRKIIRLLEDKAEDQKDACINKVGKQYTQYFSDLLRNFDRDFSLPPARGLGDAQRDEYTENLKRKLADYRKRKIDSWHEISNGIVLRYISNLKDDFQSEISEYASKREEIQDILSQKNFSVEDRIQVATYDSSSSDDVSLSAAKAGAMKKMFIGATGGALGAATAGVGAATAANVYAGTQILLAAGLSLTPVGWALLGASAVTGGALAWWQRRNEVEKFHDEMRVRVKQEFEKLLDTSSIQSIQEKVGELFSPFESTSRGVV